METRRPRRPLEGAPPPTPADTLELPYDEVAFRKVVAFLELPTLAAVLDECERRLRRYTASPLLPLIEQSTRALRDIELATKALKDRRLPDEARSLPGLGYIAGFYDGFDYFESHLREIGGVYLDIREHDLRKADQRKSAEKRAENQREKESLWYREAKQLWDKNPNWPRKDVIEKIAEAVKRHPKTVDDRIRKLERARGSLRPPAHPPKHGFRT